MGLGLRQTAEEPSLSRLGDDVDTAAQPQKTCTICGLDCSNKPRTKDAQGRYVCKECFQRAQAAHAAKQDAAKPKPGGAVPAGAARSPGAASDAGDNAFILDIVEPPKVGEGQKPCPSCGRGVNEGQVLCTSCGFNMKTGERALVNVLKPVEIRDKSERNRSGGGMSGVPEWLIGVAALVIIGPLLGYAFATEDVATLRIASTVHSLYAFVTIVSVLVLGFRDSVVTGVLLIVTCCIYALYWVFFKCESAIVKWMYGAAIILSITSTIMQLTKPDLFAELFPR